MGLPLFLCMQTPGLPLGMATPACSPCSSCLVQDVSSLMLRHLLVSLGAGRCPWFLASCSLYHLWSEVWGSKTKFPFFVPFTYIQTLVFTKAKFVFRVCFFLHFIAFLSTWNISFIISFLVSESPWLRTLNMAHCEPHSRSHQLVPWASSTRLYQRHSS